MVVPVTSKMMRGRIVRCVLFALLGIFCCRNQSTQPGFGGNGGVFFAQAFSVSPIVGSVTEGSAATISRTFQFRGRDAVSNQHKLGASQGDDDASDTAATDASKALREQAEALRQEVAAFEASKREESDQQQAQADREQREKKALRLRYSAVVPILKGDGTVAMERCDFPPRLATSADAETEDSDEPSRRSRILAVQATLPLGIVLGQDEQLPLAARPTTIDAVAAGSHGQAAGLRVGDCLRACTACQVTMEQPTWQLLAGGIGRPKTTRMMFGTDGKAFEEVLDAIASNAMDPEGRDVWLVVERMDDDEDDEGDNEEA